MSLRANPQVRTMVLTLRWSRLTNAGLALSLMPKMRDSFPSNLETKVSKIREWLRICDSTHPECRSKWHCRLPRRLVDLDADEFKGPKLVLTASLKSNDIRYTVLSYCWGASRFLKTTKETVAAYHNEIPHSELPKTFLDAIFITRELGLRYIWIDALCIIQDDHDDWAAESSKMGDIYHGSTLSVTANDSTSTSGGVFIQGSASLFERTTYARAFLRAMYPKNNKETLIHVVPEQGDLSALNERGWTLQESILSPRTIGVTNSELKWSCERGTFWESGIEYAQYHSTRKYSKTQSRSCSEAKSHLVDVDGKLLESATHIPGRPAPGHTGSYQPLSTHHAGRTGLRLMGKLAT
jgi:hypothetical protein